MTNTQLDGAARQRLESLIARFSEVSVLVVGDLILDKYTIGKPTRISREAPIAVLEYAREYVVPGGGTNPACTVASLGGRACLAGVIGEDESGRELLDALHKYKVVTDAVVTDPSMRCPFPTFLAPAFFALISLIPRQAGAQGCVAGRCPVGLVQSRPSGLDISAHPGTGWQASIGYRWLHSDRQYVGSDYQEQVTAANRQFINDLNSVDLGLTYNINPRWSVSLTVPWVENSRSSPIRGGNGTVIGRSEVSAGGIGDIRLSANYWLWDPVGHPAAAAADG